MDSRQKHAGMTNTVCFFQNSYTFLKSSFISTILINYLPTVNHIAPNFSLMVNLNYDLFRIHTPQLLEYYPTASQVNKFLIQEAELKTWLNVSYALEGFENNEFGHPKTYHPPTLYTGGYNKESGILSYKANSVSEYESWLQTFLDEGTGGIKFTHQMKFADEVSKISGVPFINLAQGHLVWAPQHKLKEPSNEELNLITNLAISYGAKGIMYFSYGSHGTFTDSNYQRGLTEPQNFTPRTNSVYNQNKWHAIVKIDSNVKKWGPYIMSFDNTNRKTYILRLDYNDLYSQTFFSDIITYRPFGAAPNCNEDNPGSNPSGLVFECKGDRYLQVATFQNSEPNTKYFMIVNRRCSPFLNDSTNNDNNGGRRFVRIKLDSASSSFAGFNNWFVIDVSNDSLIKTFDKNTKADINLGWYLPGEGKLYKIVPVMQEGGALVTDEDCSGEFDCKGEVNNNGYDINIRPGTTINFADSSARIIMTEGDFKSGISPSENTSPVYLKGKSGNFWKGIQLQNCPNVEIVRTYFENISPYELDSTYAADIINCGYVNISHCSFLSEPNINAGGVRANFTTDDGLDIEAYIFNNYFKMDAGDIPALSVITSGYLTFPVIIEGNNFESFTGNSSNAILLSGIEGGAVKENTISGYTNGIILLWSAMDIYGNVIDGGSEDSHGILSYTSSYANLGEVGIAYTGGYNSIFCEGENAKCIDVDYSFLHLDKGYNTFDLKNYEPGNAYHLSGDISDEAFADPFDATYNCFQISGTDSTAVHNMIWSSSEEPINFNFQPDYCGDNPAEGMIAFNLGNGMYDTIYTESGGNGGSISNVQFSMFNEQSTTSDNLLDSVSLNLRKRDYGRVSELCYELLTDHIDSLNDATIVSKLYLAELRLDSSGNRINNLKSFLETLILDNPGKETFVKLSFYVIQKCKVSLEMYESAMTGFQEVINQNPYGYEGLIASWDFSATSLLYNLQSGSGGGITNYELLITNENRNNNPQVKYDYIDDINQSQIQNPKFQILDNDPKDKYDSKKFTKEDRKVIRENVIHSFQTKRETEIEKVKSLEEKVRKGNANENDKSELNVKKTLGEAIKVRKPRDITEHINNVNGNIQKVFGAMKDHGSKEVINIIPTEYSLSQNYPNPFNPVTKINFDLPQDDNVKLIVYDLLGREIIRLLNNEFKVSGRYTVDFNGSHLSSGIYFYKIEAGDFIATKKMVLLK